jgi:hypothetical protein
MNDSLSVGTYLYAVVAGDHDAGVCGPIGIDGGEVHSIVEGDLAAAVSRVSRPRLRPERKLVGAHNAVVARLMRDGPVLPAAFGILASTEDAVRSLLDKNREPLLERLSHLAGKVEMGLRVSMTVPNFVDAFVTAHPELRAVRARMHEKPNDMPYGERLDAGRLFASLLESDRAAYLARVAAILGPHGFEVKPRALRAERDMVNVACLVPSAELDTFEKAVDTLGSTLDDRFKIELVGPLPPYHFADLRLAE